MTTAKMVAGRRPGETVTYVPMDDCPEHAAALGRLFAHWAVLELYLTDVLEYLIDINRNYAKAIWQQFNLVDDKIKLMRRINNVFEPVPLKDDLETLLKEAEALRIERNAYAHGMWTQASDPAVLIRLSHMAPSSLAILSRVEKPFTVQDIQNDVERIATLSRKVVEWIDKAQAAKLAEAHALASTPPPPP